MTKNSFACRIMLGVVVLTSLSLPASAEPSAALARLDTRSYSQHSSQDGILTVLSIVGAIVDNVIANQSNDYYYDEAGNAYIYEAGYDYYCERCHRHFVDSCCSHWPSNSRPYRLIKVTAGSHNHAPHFNPPARPRDGRYQSYRRPGFIAPVIAPPRHTTTITSYRPLSQTSHQNQASHRNQSNIRQQNNRPTASANRPSNTVKPSTTRPVASRPTTSSSSRNNTSSLSRDRSRQASSSTNRPVGSRR